MLGIIESDVLKMQLAVSMVCFCDIPLSKVKFHLSCYGNYGIGMTKEWGVKNKVSPVIYANPDSETISLIKEMLKIARYKEHNVVPPVRDIGIYLTNLLRFIKPYVGNSMHNKKNHKKRRYYDEREWRYVPTFDKMSFDKQPFLSKEEYLNDDLRSKANERLKGHFTLPFGPDDIEYIIVKTKNEVPSIINDIMNIKARFGEDVKRLLISKIISSESISSDF